MTILISRIVRLLFGVKGGRLSAADLEISRRICALKGLRVDGGGVSISPHQLDPGEPEFLTLALDHMRLLGCREGFLSFNLWRKLGRPEVGRYVAASKKAVESARADNLRFSDMISILEKSFEDELLCEKKND